MKTDVISKVMSGEKSWIRFDRGLLRVTGGDRVRFLNGQVTNDVSKILKGESAYAATCTAKGKMIADFWITNQGEEFWIDTTSGLEGVLKERLEKYLIADDVEISFLEGYRLWHCFGDYQERLENGEIGIKSLRFSLLGRDYWVQGEKFLEVKEEWDEESFKVLRILNRVPEWGRELSSEILPPEAGMDRNAIRYDKGCYVGQEVMARIKSIGHVSKSLVLLESFDAQFPVENSRLMFEDKNVGWVTTAALNPLTGRGIALGYLSWMAGKTASVLFSDGLALTIRPENV